MQWILYTTYFVFITITKCYSFHCDTDGDCQYIGSKRCCYNTCTTQNYCRIDCTIHGDCPVNTLFKESVCQQIRLPRNVRTSSKRCKTHKDCSNGRRCSEYYGECFSCGCDINEDCIDGKCQKVDYISVDVVLGPVLIVVVVLTIIIACSCCFCKRCRNRYEGLSVALPVEQFDNQTHELLATTSLVPKSDNTELPKSETIVLPKSENTVTQVSEQNGTQF